MTMFQKGVVCILENSMRKLNIQNLQNLLMGTRKVIDFIFNHSFIIWNSVMILDNEWFPASFITSIFFLVFESLNDLDSNEKI